jgi:hypothetical protein
MPKGKEITNQKYIYLAMAYQLAKQNEGSIVIGNDNGMTGSQKFLRWFTIGDYKNEITLKESKNGANFADYSKYFLVVEGKDRLRIYQYIDENGDNYSTRWDH